MGKDEHLIVFNNSLLCNKITCISLKRGIYVQCVKCVKWTYKIVILNKNNKYVYLSIWKLGQTYLLRGFLNIFPVAKFWVCID